MFTVHEHLASSPVLQKALRLSLPYSINLVYRTQHPNRTSYAHILATFPKNVDEIPHCWAAAYYDRSMRPETDMWIFASGEMKGHNPYHESFCPSCRIAVLAIMDYLSTLPVPAMHPDNLPALELAKQHEIEYPETGPNARYPLSTGSYMRHLLNPSVVTLGACHHEIVKICSDVGLIPLELPGRDSELNKFIFRVSDLPRTKKLPKGLRWGEVREEDVTIVQARTSIPRTRRTLLSLKSVCVFDEKDTPVAWTFLGLDGSLTTLHVEPEYRGNGVAKAVAAKAIREFAPGLAVDGKGDAWAHADVYVGNVQSEGVCRSLGATVGWQLFWIRIDVGKAGKLAGAE
ncbi:hypothetical protein CC78DRAFT_136069 [Lojkania enalia]|uniref:N-acetyltransferase domain-containing protein n=1 Tax=Lojkania enalia TaxID=147567 RepID=A0A9P4NCF2_9PLEO|nr:hypothetical protein CC78DRAFT_136069 [Didymosphaeria enalia]